MSELFVSLIERAWATGAYVASFEAEPACWWPNGLGGYLKPDAYALLARNQVRDHYWIEVDLATESLPTLKRKLITYLDFVERGQLGPNGVIPRTLIVVPTEQRHNAIRLLLAQLPEPTDKLFGIVTESRAADYLMQALED